LALICGGSNTTQSSYGLVIQNTVGGYKSVTSGSIAGTTMTLATAPTNPILVGMVVYGTGVTSGTTITGVTNPTSYTVSISQTVSTTNLSTVPAFYPAICRIGTLEIDYPKAAAIKIMEGVDYDFVMPYVNGAVSDGLYVNSNIDSYNVRITGGKLVGNGGYGINNAANGAVLISGSIALTDNTSGETNGNIQTKSPRLQIDDYFYLSTAGDKTLASGLPQINFAPNDYISYARSTNELTFLINGVGVFEIESNAVNAFAPFKLKSYTVAELNALTGKQVGWKAMATDATATTFASIVAGGGGNVVPVYWAGADWRIG